MSGDMRFANVPSDPLEPRLALPNRVLGGGVGKALHPPASLSCATIMLCDPSPRAAPSAHLPPGFHLDGRVPSRVEEQSQTNL